MKTGLPLFFSFKFFRIGAGIALCFPGCISNSAAQQPPVIEWQKTIGGNNDDELFAIHRTIDGGFILGGYSASGISGDKTEIHLGARDYEAATLIIYNMPGSVVQLQPGGNMATGVDVGALAPGLYWVSIVSDNIIFRAKFAKSSGK